MKTLLRGAEGGVRKVVRSAWPKFGPANSCPQDTKTFYLCSDRFDWSLFPLKEYPRMIPSSLTVVIILDRLLENQIFQVV